MVVGACRSSRSRIALPGEGDPRRRQHWPELYRGDGYLVQQIVTTLAELPRLTLTAYYVLGPLKIAIAEQAAAFELGSTRNYWRCLEVAEACVDVGQSNT